MPRTSALAADDDTRESLERPPLEPSDTTVSEPPTAPASASQATEPKADGALEARLRALLPRLVAEGRVEDIDELRTLALRIGLDALSVVYS